jgi:hypothetical protein
MSQPHGSEQDAQDLREAGYTAMAAAIDAQSDVLADPYSLSSADEFAATIVVNDIVEHAAKDTDK